MCCDQEMYVLKEVSERRLFERRLTLLVCVRIPVLSRLRSLRPHLLDELAHRCNMPRGPALHPGFIPLRRLLQACQELLVYEPFPKCRHDSFYGLPDSEKLAAGLKKRVLREADRSPATHRFVPNSSEPSSPICPPRFRARRCAWVV